MEEVTMDAHERRRRDLLHVLGDGGTYAMVDRVLAWLEDTPGAVLPADMMGLAEAADFLGVKKQRLWNWTADPSKLFPKPIVTLKSGPVFARHQVENWKSGNTDLINGERHV